MAPPLRSDQLLYLTLYLVLLLITPFAVSNTNAFVALIFAIRIALLVPALVPRDLVNVGRRLVVLYSLPWMVLYVLSLGVVLRNEGGVLRVVKAVGEGEAVAALGWDYVICGISVGVWGVRVGGW